MTNDAHVVLGATGGTGSALVEALAQRGHRVRAVSRRGDAAAPAGVQRIAADITHADDLRGALDGATVVYHCAQPDYVKWEAEFPTMNRVILEATIRSRAKLVFADNLYMYDASRAITEATPETALGRRSRLRASLAEDLLAAHRDGRIRVAIGRLSDYYGPRGTNSALGHRFFSGVLGGKRASWLGTLDAPHTCSYLPDTGRALAILGELDEADGQAWILPASEPVTGRTFIAMAAEAAGTDPKPVATSPSIMRMAGLFVPLIRAVGHSMYQWTAQFTVDASAFRDSFGPFETTPHPQALEATVAWFRQQGGTRTAAPTSPS